MTRNADPVLLIAGPTASGKTALSMTAARAFDGEIINADSMQIYREIPILSAQPTRDERGAIPHHLFGVLSIRDTGSVGWWVREATRLINEVRDRGNRPILVGGTGLYFHALTTGLADIPDISPQARGIAESLEAEGIDALRAAAERHDPVAASRAKGDDRQRLRRIVEVGETTGQAISTFQDATRAVLGGDDWTGLVIEPNREELYERINARFDTMLEGGALHEARALLDENRNLPALKAVGLPSLLAHLDNGIDLDAAVELAKRDSRRYAKRQYTWFRNQCSQWSRLRKLDVIEAQAEFQALLPL